MPLWTPARLTTALWLDASDSATLFDATSGGNLPANGAGVARWEDKSGNARHATQSDSTLHPLRRSASQNGLDCLEGDASNDRMLLPSGFLPTGAAARALFVVAKQNINAAGVRTIFSYGGTANHSRYNIRYSGSQINIEVANGVASATIDSPTNYNLLYAAHSSGSLETGAQIRITGNLKTLTFSAQSAVTLSTTDENRSIFYRTSAGDAPINGLIAEMIFFSSVPSSANRELIEGYLAWKWGLESDLPAGHPYKNYAPRYGEGRRQRNTGGYGL